MDKRKLGALIAAAVTLSVTVAAPAGTATAVREPAAAQAAEQRQAAEEEWEFPELRQGSRGDVVRIAQRLLTYHGHPTAVDGIFGPRTAQRVRELQADGGLPVTGAVDVATWERLVVEARRGDSGEPVRVLQWLLSFHGFPLAQDGIFGPRTEVATRAFQQKYDLPPSGVASLRTWRVLVAGVKA